MSIPTVNVVVKSKLMYILFFMSSFELNAIHSTRIFFIIMFVLISCTLYYIFVFFGFLCVELVALALVRFS